MGYNGVDYFSPENDYCIAADQLGWRLAHIRGSWQAPCGQYVVVVANFAEQPKQGYAIGLPFAGDWLELLNSDVYGNFPNPVGNGGHARAWNEPLDGFAARAAVTLPANGVIVLAPSGAQ